MSKFILFLILVSCGSEDKKKPLEPKPWPEQKALLQAKFDTYLELSKTQQDSDTQWIETKHDKCDGTLFNGIYASVGGDVDLNLARDSEKKGKFYRSPQQDCYQKKESKSECSRDMYLGVMLWAIVNKDVQTIKDIIAWGRQNSSTDLVWTMCEGDIFRTQFRPNLIGTTYHILFHLGGGDNPLRFSKQSWPSCEGFECHLQALHIFIRSKAAGEIDETDLKALRKLAEKYPTNSLFQAMYSRFDESPEILEKAAKTILDESLFPAENLPKSEQRCGFYLWQREPDGKSWKPCEDKRTHSGIDFLFAASILSGAI